MHRTTWRSLAACGLLLALGSCASQPEDPLSFESAPLFGMIYDGDNQPCAGAALEVDGRPGPVADPRGRFVVPDLGRGRHRVVARREGFEDLSVQIDFLSRTDVLHLEMTSFDQLLDRARDALRERRWADAEALLQRAGRLDPGDALLRYLLAVHAYRTGAYEAAAGHLVAILDAGVREPAVLLLLADLCEEKLDDPAAAIARLAEYLELRDDPELRARLEKLEAAAAAP